MWGIGVHADSQEMVAEAGDRKSSRASQWYRLSGLN